MAGNSFGIDLGTSNIKIYNKGKKKIFNEKNILAIADKKNLFAVGDEAYEMYEKAPSNIIVSYPINNGVIADIENMQKLFKKMLSKAAGAFNKGAEYYMAVPTDITEVEKRAFYDLIHQANLKEKRVYLVEKAVADAVGLDIDVNQALGSMVVNIGADTTEISVLSLGGIVISKLLQIGGNQMDESIQNAIKRQYNLLIGSKTAETIKKELSSAVPSEERTAKVYGRDIVTGLPVTCEISSNLIYQAIIEQLHMIVDNIKVILERTPPELAADIIETGVFVTGGSSNIHAFDTLISEETELRVNTCEKPDESVVRGLEKIITSPGLKELAYESREK